MTIMRSLMRQMPYLGPARKKLRSETLKEGPRRLSDGELRKAFSTFSSRSSDERYRRFMAARAAVEEKDGSVDIVQVDRVGLRLRMRLEFPTSDRTIDQRLHALVAGMGFDLTLESRPMAGRPRDMERTYAVTERKGSDTIEYAHSNAERLLRLEYMLSRETCKPSMGEVVRLPARAAKPQEIQRREADQMVAIQATR